MKSVIRWFKSWLSYSDRKNPRINIEDLYIDQWDSTIREDEIYKEEFAVQIGDYNGDIHIMYCRITDVKHRTLVVSRGVSLEVLHILGKKPIKFCNRKEYREVYHDILSNELTVIVTSDDKRRYIKQWQGRQRDLFPTMIKVSY